MANDAATLVIGTGHFYTAPTGTPAPAAGDIKSPASPWTEMGHTSLEDIFTVSSEGGEATTIGTLQNKALRTKYSPRTETIAIILQEFGTEALKLYYGANAVIQPDGSVGVPTDPVPTTCAWLAVFVDGENTFFVHAPKAEIYRGDDLAIGDTESLAGLPLGIKPMSYGPNAWTYALSPLGIVAASGATAGIPGSFTPEGSTVPATLAGMDTITADPTSPWTTGQYVVIGDGSHAYWDGVDWLVGEAP